MGVSNGINISNSLNYITHHYTPLLDQTHNTVSEISCQPLPPKDKRI
uniref:Uncharacterized protein n=1 Tax=Vibrio sp. FF_286 TaxID=1652831 RepID=A0A0H3ZRT5_9VIBR|nr:hypothetical protein [Vibrio sp. FF_286]